MKLFKRKNYIILNQEKEGQPVEDNLDSPSVPDGIFIKCNHCKKTIYTKEMGPLKICPKCNGHFRMSAWERIESICDADTFVEYDKGLTTKNPMNYPKYEGVIKRAQDKSGLNEGVVSGIGKIDGKEVVIAVMDSNFMMGSMGSVVGEKVTRAIERGTEKNLPVIVFTTSGGARMQEGIISLMQMAKTSAALNRHGEKGLLYISVMTDPTTGGVSASFASLGDIIIAEPKTLIGFAGQRVIEGTINEKLPEGFQSAEFQLEHGFIDKIVERSKLRKVLSVLIRMHKGGGEDE